MDGFIIALGIIVALVGVYGLYFAVTGGLALQNPVTGFLFAVRGAEPSRWHTAFSSGALVVLGVYCILSSTYPEIPLWPSVIGLVIIGALQLAAHLQRDGV